MSLFDDIEALKARIFALEETVKSAPYLRWATVVNGAPLSVLIDGDADALPDPPDTLVAGLMAGDRVRVIFQNRRATILGRGGG